MPRPCKYAKGKERMFGLSLPLFSFDSFLFSFSDILMSSIQSAHLVRVGFEDVTIGCRGMYGTDRAEHVFTEMSS